MPADKRSKKLTARRAARTPKAKGGSKSILDEMTPSESAAVLRTLLKQHPDLKSEAEAVAVGMVSSPSVDDIAGDVLDAVTSLGIDAFHGRAGKQPGGYVEPSQAAWDLLGEAVEDVVTDMKRRMDLGLDSAAEAICCGIVIGLHKAEGVGSEGPLGWAPDFPAEEACYAVAELIRTCPAGKRGAVCDRIVEALSDVIPQWTDMISRAGQRAMQGK
jgi:hypothetical protein